MTQRRYTREQWARMVETGDYEGYGPEEATFGYCRRCRGYREMEGHYPNEWTCYECEKPYKGILYDHISSEDGGDSFLVATKYRTE